MSRAIAFLTCLLACAACLAASDGPVVPELADAVDGMTVVQRFAGRLVYLPDKVIEAEVLLHRINAARAAVGSADRIPHLGALYDPAVADGTALQGWRSDELVTWYDTHRDTVTGSGFAICKARFLEGVSLLIVPDPTVGRGLQQAIDDFLAAEGVPPSRPIAHQERLSLTEAAAKLWQASGVAQIGLDLKPYIMIAVGILLLYLGIAKGFEPLLLVPIAVGCILVNSIGAHIADLPGSEAPGILGYFYTYGIGTGIFPLLIFLGVGALTDFGPLLANPWLALLGGAAQFGIFGTFFLCLAVSAALPESTGISFTLKEAGALAIIGGADGPTSIFVASKLAPHLLGAIAVAAYSYMALVPIIQPPIMKLCTTMEERKVMMQQRKEVSRKARIAFPICVTLTCSLLLPDAVPLIGMLMFGNLLRECKVTDRLLKAAQNELINLVTIALGLTVGTKLAADAFLNPKTLAIVVFGCIAFMLGTAAGVILGKVMYRITGGKVNPLIGAAGVSAVPMAARVAHNVGQLYNKRNFLLMHAMGPNVSGVIGSAVAAGILLALLNG